MPRVWELVIQDIEERDRIDYEREGTPRRPFSGHDALRNAYEEALDLCVYLRQALYERDSRDTAAEQP